MATRFVFVHSVDTPGRDGVTTLLVGDEQWFMVQDDWIQFRGPGLDGLNVPFSNIKYWRELND